MSTTPVEVVRPDVIMPGEVRDTEHPFQALDPCPNCDAVPHDSPEGIHDVHSVRRFPGAEVGHPKWNFPHCWKCGFRPGTNTALSNGDLARQFEAFKAWMDQERAKLANERGIAPPADNSEVDALKLALQQAQAREQALITQMNDQNKDQTGDQ
jgi:hypothetical protein